MVKKPKIDYTNGSLLMNPVAIEKGTVLRLLQHLKGYESSDPDDIHSRILKALEDIIAEFLAIMCDVSFRQSKLSRNFRDAVISNVGE